MRTCTAIVGTLIVAGALAACSKDTSSEKVSDTKMKEEPSPEAKPDAKHPPEPKADTTAAAPGGMGPDGLPSEIPSTRSKVPTVAEWEAMTKEITVARSTPLGCETKMVREWLRVSCRGKNDKGGEPTDAQTKASGGLEAYTFAKNKVASVVVPVLRGKKYEATFSWTDRKQALVVDWPNGAPRPSIKFVDP